MKNANPYLNFNGNTEEAFEFYRSVFGGEFLGLMRFRDFEGNEMGVPEHELDKVAHVALPIGASLLMGTDVLGSWPQVQPGTNFFVTCEADSADEARRVFDALSAGGNVTMALQATSWAEQYGTFTDRFGIQWMIMYTGSAQYAEY